METLDAVLIPSRHVQPAHSDAEVFVVRPEPAFALQPQRPHIRSKIVIEIDNEHTTYSIAPSRFRLNIFTIVLPKTRFQELARKWKEDTWYMSSITDMAEHPAYREIIGMGEPAIPFLLNELQRDLDHWFFALREIAGVNPVPLEDAGYVDKMRDAWLSWGRKNNHI